MADQRDEPPAIDLSALAHRLREKAASSAERDALIERLRKQVKSGEYQVDSEALARKLIEEAERNPQPGHCPDEEEAK